MTKIATRKRRHLKNKTTARSKVPRKVPRKVRTKRNAGIVNKTKKMKGGGVFTSKKKSDNVILTFSDLQGMVEDGISITVSDGYASIEGRGKKIAKLQIDGGGFTQEAVASEPYTPLDQPSQPVTNSAVNTDSAVTTTEENTAAAKAEEERTL